MKKISRKHYYIFLIVILLAICGGIFFFSHRNTKAVTLRDNISQVHMKDNENGWALTSDGELISTNDSWKSEILIKEFNWESQDVPSTPALDFKDDTLFVAGFLPDQVIGVYRSMDGGDTWNESHIDYSREDGSSYQVYSTFINDKDGYVLYCGGPAAGLMTKILYETKDGGKTFQKSEDLSDKINGYPTGITFNADGKGYITCSYHGNDESYLYLSEDEGHSWAPVVLKAPKKFTSRESYAYINGYPVNFTGEKDVLVLNYVDNQEKNNFITYTSSDNGDTWGPTGDLKIQFLLRYHFPDVNTIFAIDDKGNLRIFSVVS